MQEALLMSARPQVDPLLTQSNLFSLYNITSYQEAGQNTLLRRITFKIPALLRPKWQQVRNTDV